VSVRSNRFINWNGQRTPYFLYFVFSTGLTKLIKNRCSFYLPSFFIKKFKIQDHKCQNSFDVNYTSFTWKSHGILTRYIYFVWSSGSIVSDYGLDDLAIGIRSPAGAKDFSSSLCVQTGSGAHPASCTMGTRGPFPGGKSAAGA
jgi:hypothetical protein